MSDLVLEQDRFFARAGAAKINRVFAMPNSDTFSVAPIGAFVKSYLVESSVSVDPFARNKRWATYTNDLNPDTAAESHVDAEDFLIGIANRGVVADLVIFDPPYSPRQISECYKSIGRTVTTKDTQNAALYARVRRAILPVLRPFGIVLSFGWNSVSPGAAFNLEEMLIVCHGGAHNDTICTAWRLG